MWWISCSNFFFSLSSVWLNTFFVIWKPIRNRIRLWIVGIWLLNWFTAEYIPPRSEKQFDGIIVVDANDSNYLQKIYPNDSLQTHYNFFVVEINTLAERLWKMCHEFYKMNFIRSVHACTTLLNFIFALIYSSWKKIYTTPHFFQSFWWLKSILPSLFSFQYLCLPRRISPLFRVDENIIFFSLSRVYQFDFRVKNKNKFQKITDQKNIIISCRHITFKIKYLP